MEPSEQLNELLNALRINEFTFTKAIGVSTGHFREHKQNKRGFSTDTITKIIKAFPKVNPDFLYKGEGSVFKSGVVQLNQTLNIPVVTVDTEGVENIVFVRTAVQAGYLNSLTEPEFLTGLPAFHLPGNDFKGGTFRAFEVKGESMSPTILPGDWLIARYVSDFSEINNGHVYIIVTSEGIVAKRIINRVKEREHIILNSDNPEYTSTLLLPSEVKELWYVKGRLTFRFESQEKQMRIDLQHLKADVAELQDIIRR